ncbi:MAG: hypothetical protein MJ183_00340 [Treponemataceae bacterium]|nr:hypothetical protein [Treponemataceae bacterium]
MYMNTGGGHRASAQVLQSLFREKYREDEVEVKLINCLGKRSYFGKFILEDFYHFSLNLAPGLFSGTYRVGIRPLQSLTNHLLALDSVSYLRRIFEEEQPTDVVCFHFGMVFCIRRALRQAGLKPNLTCMVLDPFTAHSVNFYFKDVDYFVYSEKVKQSGIREWGVPPERITVIPFLLNPKFKVKVTDEKTAALRRKLGIRSDRKVVLITGGGEGLPNTIKIVTELLLRKMNVTVIAVCGRSRTLKAGLEVLSLDNRSLDLKVMGFVDNMDELVQVCDCAVIKAGPSSVMEVAAFHKPMILCHFIYGQELGNVQFILENDAGVFKRKAKDIADSIEIMLKDEKRLSQLKKNVSNLPISFESEKVVDLLMAKKR